MRRFEKISFEQFKNDVCELYAKYKGLEYLRILASIEVPGTSLLWMDTEGWLCIYTT